MNAKNNHDDMIQKRMQAQFVLASGAVLLLGTTAVLAAKAAPSVTNTIANMFSAVLRSSGEAIKK